MTYLEKNKILSQWTPLEIPQWNGVSERRNWTMLDMVQSMMGFATLPLSFWGYALETACYLLNNVLSKSIIFTPYEMWTGHKSSISHLRVWGCPTYVKHLDSDKLGLRFDRCLFMGYPKETKGYFFYLEDE